MLTAFTFKIEKDHRQYGTQRQSSTAGDSTSSISFVFDFSSESTLEWRLLTVLLQLAKRMNSFRIMQVHAGQVSTLPQTCVY